MKINDKLHAPAALSTGKIARVEGWVGPRIGPYSKGRIKNLLPLPGMNP
jgi:hypothetical protein